MRVKQITGAEALQIAMRAEDHFFDRKAAQLKGAKLQKIAVAFANADGGEIALGVADDKDVPEPEKRWAGLPTLEDYNQHLQALMEVKPTIPFEASFLKSSEHPNYVLYITIEKSNSVHACADNSVFERMGAQSSPIKDQNRIQQLSYSKGATTFEDSTVDSAYAEHIVDSEEIRRFLGEYSPSTDPLDLSINSNFIDRKTFKPRVSGLLLFADKPSNFIPRKCSVRIARYTTKEEEPDRDHLDHVESLEGPLYNLISMTVARVTGLMSSIRVWTIDGPKELAYPPETLWEIIVNAFIHRDYSISDDVQIHIYENRIEVTSPGKFAGYVNRENIKDVRYSRNPRIVGTLTKYRNPPNKDIGEGINTAFQKMKEWRLQAPEIMEEGNYVKVTIPHAPLATPQELVMEFIARHGSITNKQARDLTGIKSENAMKSEFYKLRDANLIEMDTEMKGNRARWLAKKA